MGANKMSEEREISVQIASREKVRAMTFIGSY
jgi:hypothetical protein